jgi:formylglycine-generating enzyme required for sulfatase activity
MIAATRIHVKEKPAITAGEHSCLREEGRLDDPVNLRAASARALRGGSWRGDGWDCRSAYRLWLKPKSRHISFGFRLAAVPVVGAKDGREC